MATVGSATNRPTLLTSLANRPPSSADGGKRGAGYRIENYPRGGVVVALLRRTAYSMMTLFRSVTQRSAKRRATPWLDLPRWFHNAIISATDADVEALRPRPLGRSP